jgi:hypothetical protein
MEDKAAEGKPIQGSPSKLRPSTSYVAVLLIVLVGAIGFYFFSVADKHAPAAISVLPCRNPSSDVRRVRSDFGATFDIPEKDFNIRTATQDMPPGRFYVVTLKNSSGNLLIGHNDGIRPDLKNAFRAFSRRIEARKIQNRGKLSVGTDHWGYLNNGDRWRYVEFSSGDASVTARFP